MQLIFWLIAIVVSVGAGYWVYLADKRRAIPYPWITSLLRSLVVFFTLLLILAPAIVITRNEIEKPVVLILQDNSRSIANALGGDSASYRKAVEDLAQKLADKYKVVKWGFGSTVQTDSIFQYRQQSTDIAAALARAQEYYGMQNLGAIVLASDGRFNQGINPLYQQLALHSALYTIGIGDSSLQKDLRISAVYANKTATLNNSFEVRADIVAARCKGYTNSASIHEEGNVLASAPVAVNADRYDRSVSFTIKAIKAGLHHYVITLPDAEGEKNIINNRKDIFVEVLEEKKRILIASAAPHPDINAIKDALAGMDAYKITVANADNFPAELKDYDALILHGLPSAGSHIQAKILAAHKPVWFIVGGQTNIPALNSLQQLTHISLIPSPPHETIVAGNPAFNIFTLPPQIQSVADKMPPLTMITGNIMPGPGASVLFRNRDNEDGLPVWVLQQGAVPSALLLGEGIWRWRMYEYKNFNEHRVVDECIRQTVAFLAANNSEKPFRVAMPRYVWSDQEAISLNAYLLNANNEQVNTPDVQITIADSAGHKQNFTFERSGGAYSLNIGIWAGGTYTYTAHTTFNDKACTATGSFAVETIPLELMEPGADYQLLYSLAARYGGGFVTMAGIPALSDSIAHNEHVKPLILTNTETEPLIDHKWYFFIILLVAVAEWLLRKYWLAQ